MSRTSFPWPVAVVVMAVIIVLDRITKRMIMARFELGDWLDVFPGFSLTRVHNRGIAFSLFNDGGPMTRVLLHLVIVVAILVITYLLVRHSNHSMLSITAFGLILGGALGNLIDRIAFGHVVDFINVWVRIGEKIHSWPNFNIADSAISCGAALLILHEIRNPAARQESDASDAD